jgi:hypothetical protein
MARFFSEEGLLEKILKSGRRIGNVFKRQFHVADRLDQRVGVPDVPWWSQSSCEKGTDMRLVLIKTFV